MNFTRERITFIVLLISRVKFIDFFEIKKLTINSLNEYVNLNFQ